MMPQNVIRRLVVSPAPSHVPLVLTDDVADFSAALCAPTCLSMPELSWALLSKLLAFDGHSLILSARLAWRSDPTADIAGHIMTSLDIDPAVEKRLAYGLETALHECLTNAIYHGSLRLPPMSDNELVADMMEDFYGSQFIAIGWKKVCKGSSSNLHVMIADEGEGIAWPPAISRPYSGLSLVTALSRKIIVAGTSIEFILPCP